MRNRQPDMVELIPICPALNIKLITCQLRKSKLRPSIVANMEILLSIEGQNKMT